MPNPALKKEHISPSQVNRYLACPLQTFYDMSGRFPVDRKTSLILEIAKWGHKRVEDAKNDITLITDKERAKKEQNTQINLKNSTKTTMNLSIKKGKKLL